MSKRVRNPPAYFHMLNNVRLMQTHETVVDVINRRIPQCDFLFNASGGNYDMDYPDHVYYDNLTDDDSDDDYDNEHNMQNNKYCGFAKNFLDKGVSKQMPLIKHYKTVKGVTPEEAAKNAKELLAEEEKLKKKAEKKKQKKTRQRERRRLEKLEKESGNRADSKQNAAAAIQVKPKEKECEKKKKTNNCVPSDRGPQSNSITTENSDGGGDDDDDDDDDDDGDSIVDELELDMSSCFVTNAAAIAKRKLEQQPKTDRKDKKTSNTVRHGTTHKNTSKNVNEASDETLIKDNLTKSMELAVMGNKYAQAGNLDMAVKYFTDAIKHNPQEFKLFGNRSFCYEKMQQYEKALIDADIALSLNPTWIKGLYRKGKALVGLKRYSDACLTYKEVLMIDSSCTDAAQELMRVQILQLVDMGYTREQSSNALIIHGTVEKALEALSGLHGNIGAAHIPFRNVKVFPERNPQPLKVPALAVPLRSHSASPTLRISQDPTPATSQTPVLFPVWVGDLVPVISEFKLRELFSHLGRVHSVRLLSTKRCAFINYTNKEDCDRAIKEMHVLIRDVLNELLEFFSAHGANRVHCGQVTNPSGFPIAGTFLTVRYPDRIHTHLGVSKAAETGAGNVNKFPDECCFWRTSGCIKSNLCPYRHVPEHKGIDRAQPKC